jgi:hypothetical protein
VAAAQIGDHAPPDEGRYSKATEVTPLPPVSDAVALTVAVPVSGVAAVTLTAGAVLSTRRELTVPVRE